MPNISPKATSNKAVNLLAKPISVGADEHGARYLKINNMVGGNEDVHFVSLDDVDSSRCFKKLNDVGAGMLTSASKNAFKKECESVAQQPVSFKIITNLGFHNGHFVRPDGVFPKFPEGEEVYIQLDASLNKNDLAQYRRSGTLKEWKKILPLAVGNSRVIFCLNLQFVGPISAILGSLPGVFLLFGPGQQGKTALVRWASSAHGWDKDGSLASNLGFGTSLNTTGNALERHLASRQHSFAFLDEANQVGTEQEMAKAVLKFGFNIDGGESKKRLISDNPDWQWSMAAVITSNHSFAEIVKKTGSKIGALNIDRLVDIGPVDQGFGMFENLHGHTDIPSYVKSMEAKISINHGVAGPWFLEMLGRKHLADPT